MPLDTLAIPACYMRGGTSKGVFFNASDLPSDPKLRDKILLRVLGSPDPYGQQIDGMGGASSSTSKVVIVSPSTQANHDVEYLFGQVLIDQAHIDWSGNCGNLTTAVAPYALHQNMISPDTLNGIKTIRLWQKNIAKTIIAHVPIVAGHVQENGDFELDGVTFPAAEIKLDFMHPASAEDALFPTGKSIDTLTIPGLGVIEATLINAGNPTVMVDASTLGLEGTEHQADVNTRSDLLTLCETIRAHACVAMGLAQTPEEATTKRPHTPKLAFFNKPKSYITSSGKAISHNDIAVLARIFSMGKLHHAMTGTGAVAIAAAGAIPNTIISRLLGQTLNSFSFGHPSGTLQVGAQARYEQQWLIDIMSMSRSARRLMQGTVFIPSLIP